MNEVHAPIAVVGANGHTGAFVVRELLRRGLPVLAIVRDAAKAPPGVPARVAAFDDAAALDRAFAGCSVVVNCAGPFLDSAAAVTAAAIRAGCSYLDVTAEQASAQATFETQDAAARAAGVAVIPAAGFYGGLADLLASALARGNPIDEVVVAIALDHWWPTAGTRLTGERNQVPRIVIEDGRPVPMPLPAARSVWTFPEPLGATDMVALPFSEVVTISRHLAVRRLHAHLNVRSLDELRDAATPAPSAVDGQGRSAQRFTMEVLVRDRAGARRALARGQDIYAVTAPIVVEAAARLREPSPGRRGALALGQAFDPLAFISALAPEHLEIQLEPAAS
jgi:hypothetical protein